MACRSGSVDKAAQKSVDAQSAIDNLEDQLRSLEASYKAEFFARIEDNLALSGITDAEQTSYNSDIKTEYSREFSLDKIAKVVTSTLESLAASAVAGATPVITPQTIETYIDVVNGVAEAAKSSADSAANLTFAMNRIGPGTYAFLFASSVTIHDSDTFGTEAITSTAIFHRMMRSIEAVKKDTEFDVIVLDGELLKKMKHLQAALMDRLGNGEIDFDTYDALDQKYMAKIDEIWKRIDSAGVDKTERFTMTFGADNVVAQDQTLDGALPETRSVAQTAITALVGRGGDFAKAAIRNQERMEAGYF